MRWLDFVTMPSLPFMLLPKALTGDAPDRRRRPRLRLAYAIRLHRPGGEALVETKTHDLSCEGFFCIADRAFSPHDKVECELVIPTGRPDQLFEQDIILRCRAEVVRVEWQGSGGAFGVACRFADYTLDRQIVEQNLTLETVDLAGQR
jgi:hypothetical protein